MVRRKEKKPVSEKRKFRILRMKSFIIFEGTFEGAQAKLDKLFLISSGTEVDFELEDITPRKRRRVCS